MLRHATLLGEWIGDESRGVIDFRKHVAWYLKGFAVGSEMRQQARGHLVPGGTGRPAPASSTWTSRGRTAPTARGAARPATTGWSLPDGWLKDPYDCAGMGADAELDTSGG